MVDYTLDEQDDVLVVRLRGSLDAYLRDFTPEIEGRLRRTPRHLVADLSCIDFIGSRGMGLLFHLHKLLHDVARELVLAAPSRPVVDALAVGGIGSLLRVCPTEREALDSLKTAGAEPRAGRAKKKAKKRK